ncbi:MAG TPA: HAMP domain-containing sensor histidine kinase, partial [Ktedonobacterales bacterium]
LLSVGRTHALDPASPSLFTPFDEELLAGAARLVGQALSRAHLAEQLVEMEAARRAAEAATRQRDAFLSVASHELRTPLTTLKTVNQLLLRRARAGRPAEESPTLVYEGTGSPHRSNAELLARMGRQIDRIIHLVDDLVETSRIETGHLELQFASCDLAALVRQAVAEQREVTPGRVIALRAQRGPVWIRGDVDRLQQVVANYLTNALKYSPASQPVIVTLRATAEAALVIVRDHGPGVPPTERERIWQRFHRVPGIAVVSGSGIGLGIGLYISKTFVERHGGEVGVTNALGGGARFWFCLPRAG